MIAGAMLILWLDSYTLVLMIPGSSITSGRGEAGGGGGGEGVDGGGGGGGWVEGRGCCGARVSRCDSLTPPPVTSLGGAMATNLTTPLGTFLTTDSAVARSSPISEVSFTERR